MPPNVSPKPLSFPCRIGIDFWQKKSKKTERMLSVPYKYTDGEYDCDGWCDPKLWLPYPYDLCWLKTQEKTKTGWWTGRDWEGMRIKPTDKVLYWKKCNEDMSR